MSADDDDRGERSALRSFLAGDLGLSRTLAVWAVGFALGLLLDLATTHGVNLGQNWGWYGLCLAGALGTTTHWYLRPRLAARPAAIVSVAVAVLTLVAAYFAWAR